MDLKYVVGKIKAVRVICILLNRTINGCREGILIEAAQILCEEALDDIKTMGM